MTYCVGIALVFDVFDGWAARKVGTDGPLGVQLDSLADVITFGVVPGLLWMHAGMAFLPWWFALIGLAPTLASVYRLARFNLGLAGSSTIVGLPTPANALFLFGVVWGMYLDILPKPSNAWGFVIYGAITLFSTYSLNSPWPVMSFKDLPKRGATLWSRIFFAATALALLIIYKMAAFAFIIPLLLLFSTIEHRFFKPLSL